MGYGSTLAVVGAASAAAADPLPGALVHLSGRHVFARYIEGNGHLAETILETAAEVDADVIVVAAPNGLLESVVRHARCDVFVVR